MKPGTAAAVPGFMPFPDGPARWAEPRSPKPDQAWIGACDIESVTKAEAIPARAKQGRVIGTKVPKYRGLKGLGAPWPAELNYPMSQNTVLGSQGDFSLESASCAVPPTPTVADPVRALTEAWYRQPQSSFAAPVRRPFDAQYWACWLVAVLFPTLVAYLLLTR